MIVSLTPNTTLDLTVFVPEAGDQHHHPRLRALITAWAASRPTPPGSLGRMGVGSLALGLAAGAVGEKVKSMLEELGVRTDFIEVGGETRINTVIMDESSGEHTTITTASMSGRARAYRGIAGALRSGAAIGVGRHHRRIAAAGHVARLLRRRD